MPQNFEVHGQVTMEAVLVSGQVKPDGDLSFGVASFAFEVSGVKYRFAGATSVPVTDDATNYVYIDDDGDLEVSTSGWPDANHLRLARVVALNGLILQVIDERVVLAAEIDREINEGAEENQSSTTSTVWQQKLRLTTEAIPNGKYIVQWYCEIHHSDTVLTNYVEVRVEVNDTTEIGINAWPYPAWEEFSGFQIADITGGAQNFDLDYRVQGSGTAYIRRARIVLWRIR
jgi:hypothetical protein